EKIKTNQRSREKSMQGSGCLSMESKSNRQNVSSEETIGCPFKVLSGLQCPAIGSPSDVVGHVKRHHVVDTQEKPGPFAVKLQKFSHSINFHKAIIMRNKLCYLLWVTKKDTVHFLVHITPKDECEKYTYDFKIQKGKEEISITDAICSSSLQPHGKVMPNGDIIRMHRPTVQNYLDENGDLSCVIDIRRKGETTPLGAASDTRDTIDSRPGKRKLEELQSENRKYGTLSRRPSKRTRRANFFRYVRCQTQWVAPRYRDVRTGTQRPFERHFRDWYGQQKT
ncbi:hypothetical protein Cfor_11127, partial [Coptotermes formosanus]